MTNNLYEEAIADAKKLRELAEQNAKNAIIESITPKIRELIESQIMGEVDESELEVDILDEVANDAADANEEYEITPEAAEELREMLESSAEDDPPAPESDKITEVSNQLVAYDEYIQALEDVMSKVRGTTPEELNENDLKKYVALVAISEKSCQKLEDMLESTERLVVFESVMNNTQNKIQDFKKEIKEMKRSLRDLLSEEVITLELDLGDEVEVDPSEVKVSVAEAEEVELEDEEEVEVDAEEETEDMEDMEDVDVEELEEMILELEDDVEEMDHPMEEEEDADEGYMHEEDDDAHEGHGHDMDMMEGLDDDTVLEIDENMLREELAKLMQESEDSAEEVIEEASEEEEVLEETAEPVATEQNDELQAEIESYQSAVADLQSQLAEMSLFNAKLLYTNKLLMNSDLSQTQRAQAIETLDDAASLREVKLLFKTLTESFSKRAEGKTSSRNIGGASRPTKSASMNLNESPEASRWALLAGIK